MRLSGVRRLDSYVEWASHGSMGDLVEPQHDLIQNNAIRVVRAVRGVLVACHQFLRIGRELLRKEPSIFADGAFEGAISAS